MSAPLMNGVASQANVATGGITEILAHPRARRIARWG
jgi:hypothetical protein